MADEVVKTMTTKDFLSAVVTRVHQHEREIIRCLCPDKLVPHLVACELIDFQEEGELFLKDSITRKEKEPAAHLQFLECLEEEKSHLGHAYIASLLRGEEFRNEEEVGVSSRLKKRINQCMPSVVKGLDTHALAPYLSRDSLLTDDEHKLLIDNGRAQNTRALNLLTILGTKGPTAHYTFTRCLAEEKEYRTHWELFQEIASEDNCAGFRLQSKRRKRKADNVVTVTK